MIRVEFPVEIERPVSEVFAYVTDPGRLAEWQTNVVSVTVDPPGPLRRGSRLREVRRAPLGRTVESLVEVSEHERDRRFALRMLEGPLPIHGAHDFSPTASGTRIDFVAWGEPTGAMRVVQPVLRAALRRQFRADYDRLARVLEAGGTS
jgi:uncharacterized membrane protein